MTDEIRACLHEIASEEADYHYEGAEGLWASKDQIPSDPSEFSEAEYEGLLSPERLEEINDGQQITEAELVLLQKARLENLLDNCGDADVTTGYSLWKSLTVTAIRESSCIFVKDIHFLA
jgi:hypothetical protein